MLLHQYIVDYWPAQNEFLSNFEICILDKYLTYLALVRASRDGVQINPSYNTTSAYSSFPVSETKPYFLCY